MEPYLIEDDYDDRMYKLLKQVRKEKKARKKLQKKLKKQQSKQSSETPTTTEQPITTVQPISNIVYYWPATITTIVHPGVSPSTYQHSLDGTAAINESSEDASSEVEKNDKQKPAQINYETRFSFERKLKLDDDDVQTNQTFSNSTSTTTPYPLITVFPDPEEVAIEEILQQQEIVNKIFNSSPTDHSMKPIAESTDEPLNVSNVTELEMTDKVPIYEPVPTVLEDTKDEANAVEEIVSSEPIDVNSAVSPSLVPTGALQFFHETLPEEPNDTIDSANPTEIVIDPTDNHLSNQIEETSQDNQTVDGHRTTDTQHNHSNVQLNETSTIETPKASDDKNSSDLEISIPSNQFIDNVEGVEYSFDTKVSLPIEMVEGFESRSLTDKPAVVAVIVDDKSGRRSDVPIEADDINEEDTTDNLAYNLTGENVLEQSNESNESKSTFTINKSLPIYEEISITDTSAEISKPASESEEEINFDDFDQFDTEIIPLIPIIIKQMKQGNVNTEEMEILKNTFGPFWPFIVEEVSRDNDSSEEMNPVLSEVLNSINRKVVKREATFGLRRRPIYSRRIYLDDGFASRRGYYNRRRRQRPIAVYY